MTENNASKRSGRPGNQIIKWILEGEKDWIAIMSSVFLFFIFLGVVIFILHQS